MTSIHAEENERNRPSAGEACAERFDGESLDDASFQTMAPEDDWDVDWGWESNDEIPDDCSGELVGDEIKRDDSDSEASDNNRATENDTTVELIDALVAVMELGIKRELPDSLKAQVDRLVGGDSTIDAAQVASQLVKLVPRRIAADLNDVSFSEGRIATGKRFNIAVPDGWAILKNDEKLSTSQRPQDGFFAYPGSSMAAADIALCDRIAYIENDDISSADDSLSQIRLECGTDDFNWALRWRSAYCPPNADSADLELHAIWDAEVESANTRSLVVQLSSLCGTVFQIWPYANDHSDYLSIVLENQSDDNIEKMREFVVKIAESITLDKPIKAACLADLEKAIAEKVDAGIFESMVESLSQPFVGFRQLVFDAAQYKYASVEEEFDANECLLAGARGIARLSHRAIPYLEKLLDAYDTQVACGASVPERSKMISFVGAFEGNVFPAYSIFNDEDASVIENAAVFQPSPMLEKLQARLDSARYHLRETPNEATPSTADSPYSPGGSEGKTRIGDVFELGTYHYDDDGAYKPLKWRILSIKGTHALAVSTECIEFRHYSDFDGSVSWETSTIREWLNEDFAKASFTPEDRKRISGARIANSPNDEYGTEGGNPTRDRLFLLSIEEAESLFESDEDRKASPSPYAEGLGANQWWWLRSPGYKDTHVAYVGGDGSINRGGSKACLIARSVRPAFYLKLSREEQRGMTALGSEFNQGADS